MIKFKEYKTGILPYDRGHYIDFLDDDFNSSTKWQAVSLQMKSDRVNTLSNFIKVFSLIFRSVVIKLDNGFSWIINHDDKDMSWFPNENDNLETLRRIFKTNNIKYNFKGVLILDKEELLDITQDIMSYPYILLYKNLDISHSELQFIIKITSHLTIDLLSTDKELLRKIIDENSTNDIILKEYRGTTLWT